MADATSAAADFALGSNPVGMALEAAAGAGELITGLVNSGKTKKDAAELGITRPKYNISPYAKNEVSLAESELGKGAGDDNEGADKDFSNSLSYILKGGGSVNNVGDLYANNQDARSKLASLREGIRLNQISNVTSAWRNYADQTDKQFQYNVDSPWKDKAQAVAAARTASQGQIWDGINTIGSAGMNYSEQKNATNQYGNYFNAPTQPTGTYTPPPRFSGAVPNNNIPLPNNNQSLQPNNFLYNV